MAAPRSTCSHWLSANALDQRVPGLPSTANCGARFAASWLEAVAGRPSAKLVAHAGGGGGCDGSTGTPGGGALAPPVWTAT